MRKGRSFIKSNIGEEGKSYYIIIKGSTYVLIKTDTKISSRKDFSKRIFLDLDEDGGKEAENKEEQVQQENMEKFLNNEIDENVKRNTVERNNPGFLIVKELVKGDAFGEVALKKDGDGY